MMVACLNRSVLLLGSECSAAAAFVVLGINLSQQRMPFIRDNEIAPNDQLSLILKLQPGEYRFLTCMSRPGNSCEIHLPINRTDPSTDPIEQRPIIANPSTNIPSIDPSALYHTK